MINRILHETSMSFDEVAEALSRQEGGIPANSLARPHNIKPLYSPKFNGEGLLMAEGQFGHMLRTVPVGDGGELGNMLVIGPPRRGKSDLLTALGLDWQHNLIYNDPKK